MRQKNLQRYSLRNFIVFEIHRIQGTTLKNKVELIVGLFVLMALAVLAYMSFKIGAFRFDRIKYNTYSITFQDVSGLSRKANVKIAGVTVGWVEDLELTDNGQAIATIMIHSNYIMHTDAYAIVRQDGLLGSKYLEIISGNPLLPKLQAGKNLKNAPVQQASIDEILQQVQSITRHIEAITATLEHSFCTGQSNGNVKNFFENLNHTAERLASLSTTLDQATGNKINLENLFKIGNNVNRISDQLEQSVFPSFQESIEKISRVFDRDFNRVASKLETSVDTLEQTCQQVCTSFKSVESIAEKIDNGNGLIGNLINDDQICTDIKYATQGIKSCFQRVSNIGMTFDTHFESLYHSAQCFDFHDNKGYLDIRIHPNDSHFYIIQLASSEKGIIKREDRSYNFSDRDTKNSIDLEKLDLPDWARVKWQYFCEHETFKRNTLKVGVQFGKIFGNVALRFGLFDGYFAGIGTDLIIPLGTDKLRWLMTFEAYDFRGLNRVHDHRPHVKWLNRIYCMHNMYAVFGADDFVSHRDAHLFFGIGLLFGGSL